MTDDKQNNDSPMPKVAAAAEWLTCFAICFGLILAGKAAVCVLAGSTIRTGIGDIIIAVVAATLLHCKHKGRKAKGK